MIFRSRSDQIDYELYFQIYVSPLSYNISSQYCHTNVNKCVRLNVSIILDGSENIPYSQNFMDIVKMVQNGQTPPNVRTDINDKPEDPEKPFDVQGELGKKPKVRTACPDVH
jgi:hypothetical protein